jgi:tRNA threonylcarbamoyladenosine biosynthesis protein TsaE
VAEWKFDSASAEETWRLGMYLGQVITDPAVILLNGDLGAGKTCLTQGIARGLGVPEGEAITSPTYTLMNLYQGRLPLYHFDLYRLVDTDELEELGMEEYLPGEGVAVVEWADRFEGLCPSYLEIRICHRGLDLRTIHFHAVGTTGRNLLEALQAAWQQQG